MKAHHSPGPWRISEDNLVLNSQNEGLAVTFVDLDLPWQANATLIAAAPELLSALQKLESAARWYPDELHRDHERLVEARAAIAKALGAPNA